MSASLVGSEMCIRDREPLRGCYGPPGPRRLAPLARAVSPGGLPPARTPRPVSYTHLTLPTICSV
eukprot:4275259-Alexandrium_andersonii.AAC.1